MMSASLAFPFLSCLGLFQNLGGAITKRVEEARFALREALRLFPRNRPDPGLCSTELPLDTSLADVGLNRWASKEKLACSQVDAPGFLQWKGACIGARPAAQNACKNTGTDYDAFQSQSEPGSDPRIAHRGG